MGALAVAACSSSGSSGTGSDGGAGASASGGTGGSSAGGTGGSSAGGTGGGSAGGTGGSSAGGTGGSSAGGTGGSSAGGTGGSSTGGTGGGTGGTGGGTGGTGGGTGGTGGGTGGAGGGTGGTGGGTGGTGGTGGSSGSTGNLPSVGGCAVFTGADDWNKDISASPADATWTASIQAIAGNIKLHPDYGGQYGIPINVVPQSQAMVPITFNQYASESDPGPYPFPGPGTALIEGNDPLNCSGDCHMLVVQQGTCMLYEAWACLYSGGQWACGNGAKWDLTKLSYGQRPIGWTSADAAGLPIMPGLVRYDEVQAGAINHAIRFTMNCSTNKYAEPATHDAKTGGCSNPPPMGLRVRLKASYNISGLSAGAQVVLTAMKKYGMILADNGSNFYFQGEENANWPDADISGLKSVPVSAFEAITPGPLGGP